MSEDYNRMNMPPRNNFLSVQNEDMLDKLVYQDFQRRLGSDLNEKQKQRLLKTVRHYMNEVHETIPEQNLQTKNKEVLSAVVTDFLSYIQRSQSAPPVRDEDTARMDVASRFNQLQNERNTAKKAPPAPPNFRLSLEEDGPPSLSVFERVKKEREEEAMRGQALLEQNMRAESSFKEYQTQSSQFDQQVLADRERMRQAAQKTAASEMANRLVPPDPRRIFMKDMLDTMGSGQGTPLETILNNSGLANANPTLALPDTVRIKPALPQDNIIRQDDILAYKENEYNLFIYSADRDWLINRNENRYDFSVLFDPANNGSGFSYSPTANIKFKNITRIELVKVILPIEGLDIIQTRTVTGGTPSYSTALNTNVLSFPYLMVYIPELDTNNYGTDYNLEQSFGVIQYDANWVSDNLTASKGGFLAMIPKFLKCQKVYQPTPLATLRKLSIRIQRPDGTCVSAIPDTLDVSGVKSSYNLTNCPSGTANVANTSYADMSGNYIWIQSKTWFSRFMVNQGDRIAFKGLTFPASYTGNEAAKNDLVSFLERPEGHLVVAIAYSNLSGGTTYYNDGSNIVGYSNYIIIRSKMTDPATGSVVPDTFGKLATAANNTFLNSLCPTSISGGRLINLSHQVSLVFRVITRDLDPTTRIRPDNM
jgi:hypothetical protein